MNESYLISRLFSIPIFRSQEKYEFNKGELDFFNKQKNEVIKNQGGNFFTKNNYTLNSPELRDLKEFCDRNLFKYFYEVFGIKKDIEVYITQSWVNYNQKNSFHHRHKHINSIISSVIFIKGENCPISFFNSDRNLFGNLLSPEDFNKVNENNSSQISFKNEIGRLFLFPSTLMHGVSTNQSDIERISLSFNSFIRGNLGSEENSLQKLNLK